MGLLNLFRDEQPPLVHRAFDDICTMLRIGDEMFAAATAHLLDNEILDVDLEALDEGINRREHSLRRALLEHLTIDPGHELVFSLKMLSVVHEAERLGDLAKSLAQAAALAHKPRMGAIAVPLRDARDRISIMFGQVRTSFKEGDEVMARTLLSTHEQVKADIADVIEGLAERTDITPNEAVVFTLSARLLSRVSSHLANIATAVVAPFDRIRSSPEQHA